MIAQRIADAKIASEEYKKQNPEHGVWNKGNYSAKTTYLNVSSHNSGIENPYSRFIRPGTNKNTPTPPQNIYSTLQSVLRKA